MTFWFQRPISAGTSYQLAAGHYIAKKQAMIRVHPRPDAETNTWAGHRKHHPGIPYRVPVAVAFGARPLWYELITGPSGLTVGAGWDDWNNWGVVSWTNPTTGTHSVTIRVHDQEGNTLDVDWSINVTTSGMLFIDPISGNNGNAGDINNPLASNSGWHKGTTGDSTYAGYQLYYKATTHVLDGIAGIDQEGGSNDTVPLSTNKPLVLKPWDGQPDFNMAAGAFESFGNCPDLWVSGIKFRDSATNMVNSRFFFIYGSGTHRTTCFENYFYNGRNGTTATGNESCWFITTASMKNYHAIVGNTYDTLIGGTNGFSAHDMYSCRYSVTERNIASNVQSRYLWWQKREAGDWTAAHNIAITNCATDNAPSSLIEGTSDASATDTGQRNLEFCWNTLYNANVGTFANVETTTFDGTGSGSNDGHTYWAYRNTIYGSIAELDAGALDSTSAVENNLLVNLNGETDPITGTFPIETNNVILTTGDFDANLHLTGTARTNYLGTHGAEID